MAAFFKLNRRIVMLRSRKHRSGSITDYFRIMGARQAAKRNDYSEAVQLLEGEPRSDRYRYLIPLYRLTLMVCAEDERKKGEARLLLDQEVPTATDDGRCLDAYRRYLCGGLLGDWEVSDAAKNELRQMRIKGFYRALLAIPS